jgi:lantibiotic biosynthesis protein
VSEIKERTKSISKKNSLYHTLPFYMIRRPLLSLESFMKIEDGENFLKSIKNLLEKDYVKEAIAVASPSLYKSLPSLYKESNKKNTNQVAISVLKYLSRMSTRSTPFGLFAGVASGKFSDNTNITMGSPTYFQKRTRPDMEWLFSVIHHLEQKIDVVKQLYVTRNHAVQNTGGRLELSFPSFKLEDQEKMKGNKISVKSTPPAILALKIAEKPIRFCDLISKLCKEYKEVDKEIIENFLWTLFKKDFFISELRPPLSIPSPLDYVIKKLDPINNIDEVKLMLRNVKLLIDKYDESFLGIGTDLYKKLTDYMEKNGDSKSVVQVDLSIPSNQIEIHNTVGKEISEVAEILWRLSTADRGMSHLKEYYISFIEKYGFSSDVPILELLNEDTGLGIPSAYLDNNTKNKNIDEKLIERERLLKELVAETLLNQEKEIELTNEIIDKLVVRDKNSIEAPDSMEIYAELLASNSESVDKGDFLISLNPNSGSYEAGLTYGRFLDMCDDETQEQIKNIREEQKRYQPDVIFADATYVPEHTRTANVMVAPSFRDYEISIGTNSAEDKIPLTLDDILVCADQDRLYLKSRSLKKEVVITGSNMLNFTSSPHVYRFMRELSFETISSWQPFEWGSLAQSTFLPRLRYKNTILSPATWNLYRSSLPTKQLNEQEKWKDLFKTWQTKWEVPRYVYMVFADNRILLDLENSAFLEILRKELLKNKKVTLQEMLYTLEERGIINSDEHYVTEFVFQIKKREIKTTTRKLPSIIRTISTEDKLRLPGSDWIFIKLYGSKDRQNEFITNHISKFSENMLQNGFATSWFFMRYEDPESHIRLRFNGDSTKLTTELIPSLYKWVNLCIQEGFVKKITIDTYEREIERYGGPALISAAEKVFFYDSRASAILIYLLRYNKIDFPDYVLGAISAINIMSQFKLNLEEQFDLLNNLVDKDRYRDEFRPWRRELMSIFNSPNWDNLIKKQNGNMIIQAFQTRSDAIHSYREEIIKQGDNIWNDFPGIISSVMHLHFNRLLGTNRELEIKSLAFARHAVYSMLQFQKQHHKN